MKQHPSITAVSWSAGALKLGSEGCSPREGLELWGRKEGREQSKAKPRNGEEAAFLGATKSGASVLSSVFEKSELVSSSLTCSGTCHHRVVLRLLRALPPVPPIALRGKREIFQECRASLEVVPGGSALPARLWCAQGQSGQNSHSTDVMLEAGAQVSFRMLGLISSMYLHYKSL